MTHDLLHHLTQLEQLLHHPTTRRDPVVATTLLTDDFREFGASRRTYDKPAILALLATEPSTGEPLTTTDYHLTQLGPEAALLTYTATRAGRITLRSSLWVYRDRCWQLLFHQGTAAHAPPLR